MSEDVLIIKGLKIETRIGVYDWEKMVRQHLLVDVELTLPLGTVAKAACHDDIKATLDYVALAFCIQQFADVYAFQLIETFTEKLADLLIQRFSLSKLTLQVQKPAALNGADCVAIRVTRTG